METNKKEKKFLSIKKSTKSKVITAPVSKVLEILEFSIHINIFFLIYTLIYYLSFLNYLIFKLRFIQCLQKLRFIKMVGKITDVKPSETSDNDRSIALEELIISANKECNDKTHNRTNEKTFPDGIASFTPVIVFAIDNNRNIKCKHCDIKEIYLYVSRTVATTNEGRDFIKTIVVEVVNKKINI